MNRSGSAPERRADGLQRLGDLEGVASRTSIATPLASATWPTSASSPSETSIIAVAPEPGGLRARAVGRLRTPVGLDQLARRAEAAAEHRQAAGGPALASGDRDHVAGPRARSAVPARRRTRRATVTAIDDLVRARSGRRRPPRRPTSAHSSAMPVGELERPGDRQVRGRGQPDGQRGAPGRPSR